MNDDDRAVVERDLRDDARRAPPTPTATAMPQSFSRMLAIGATQAEQDDQQDVEPRRRVLQREALASTVSSAFAWISAPGITRPRSCDVGWTSWSDGAIGPTTTILSLKKPGGPASIFSP